MAVVFTNTFVLETTTNPLSVLLVDKQSGAKVRSKLALASCKIRYIADLSIPLSRLI